MGEFIVDICGFDGEVQTVTFRRAMEPTLRHSPSGALTELWAVAARAFAHPLVQARIDALLREA